MSGPSIEGVKRAGPFQGFGHQFEIVTHEPGLADAVAALYAPLRAGGGRGSASTEYVVEPPVPGQLWQLRVDGQVTVRSSTPGGAVRMLLQSVNDRLRRGRSTQDGRGARADVLHLDAAAVEVDGTGVLLLADRGVDLTAVLVRLLDLHPDVVGYLGEVVVEIDLPGLSLHSAPTPLSLRKEHWAAANHLRALVPEPITPYLDLTWPLPATALGRVVERARLGVVLHLGVDEATPDERDGGSAIDERGPEMVPLRPAVAATRLLDRLPHHERVGLTVERLRQVAALVEQLDTLEVIADKDPVALADAVVAGVRACEQQRTSTLAR